MDDLIARHKRLNVIARMPKRVIEAAITVTEWLKKEGVREAEIMGLRWNCYECDHRWEKTGEFRGGKNCEHLQQQFRCCVCGEKEWWMLAEDE